jgi:hypothetical protein
MTRNQIAVVMKRIPALNYYGIGLFDKRLGISEEEAASELAQCKERLLTSEAECTVACEWLSRRRKTRSMNQRHNSYGFSHMVERVTGIYVSNGAFIAAAIHCGFPYRLIPNDRSVQFGIAERSLKTERTLKSR